VFFSRNGKLRANCDRNTGLFIERLGCLFHLFVIQQFNEVFRFHPQKKLVFFGRLRSIHFNRFSLTRSSGVKTPTAFTAGIIGTSRIYREY
jgi:hypothetical protein